MMDYTLGNMRLVKEVLAEAKKVVMAGGGAIRIAKKGDIHGRWSTVLGTDMPLADRSGILRSDDD